MFFIWAILIAILELFDVFDELDKFCQYNEYILSDVNNLGIDSNTATFISDANGDYRWLDHIVSSFSANHMIKSIRVLNDFIISDHRPIQMVLNIKNDLISDDYNINDDVHDRFIDWQTLSDESIKLYRACVKQNINFDIPNSIIYLHENNPKIYKNEINKYYNSIVNSMYSPGNQISKELVPNNRKYKVIPEWYEYIHEYHVHVRVL